MSCEDAYLNQTNLRSRIQAVLNVSKKVYNEVKQLNTDIANDKNWIYKINETLNYDVQIQKKNIIAKHTDIA